MVTTCGVWLLEKAAPWKITTFHLVIGPADWLSDFLPPAVPFFHRAIYRGSGADSGRSHVIRTRNLGPKSGVARCGEARIGVITNINSH